MAVRWALATFSVLPLCYQPDRRRRRDAVPNFRELLVPDYLLAIAYLPPPHYSSSSSFICALEIISCTTLPGTIL